MFAQAQPAVVEDHGQDTTTRALHFSLDAEAQAHLAKGEIAPDVRDLVLPITQEVAVAKS